MTPRRDASLKADARKINKMTIASVIVRYAGQLTEIEKGPYETEERAYDRAWWIVQKKAPITPELIAESFKWVNHKYFGMEYKDVSGASGARNSP